MPEERKYESAADRQRAYRERKRNAEQAASVTGVTEEPVTGVTDQQLMPELPETQIDEREPPAEPGERSLITLLQLDDDAPLTEVEEQRIRDHYGYAASETRTRAERAGVARRLASKLPPSTVEDKALLSREELQKRGLALEPTGADTH